MILSSINYGDEMMAPRRSDQEWKTLFQQCEESSLTIKAFCRQNNLATSAFYAKRQQLNVFREQRDSRFVHAQITERTMQYHVATPPVVNMALNIGDIVILARGSCCINRSKEFVQQLLHKWIKMMKQACFPFVQHACWCLQLGLKHQIH